MKIKIEIDSGMISPREYAVRTIAKEIVKTGIKEKQIWYNEAAIQTELENAEVKLVGWRCFRVIQQEVVHIVFLVRNEIAIVVIVCVLFCAKHNGADAIHV